MVRRAELADAPRLGEIGFEAWLDSAFGKDDKGRADRTQLRAEFDAFGIDYQHTILVAIDDAGPIGWGAREYSDHTISDLWVSPAAQGKGVGAALLAALEEAIALAGFGFAELETYAGNAGAVRFYTRQGYEPIWRGMKSSASLNYDLDKIRFRKTFSEAA